MQRLIIPDLWIPLSGLLWSWYRIHCRRSQYFCAWMIRWYPNLAQNLKMFQNCLAMPHTTVPTTWMDTAFVLISVEYWSKLLWAENFLVFLQLYGAKLQRDWNAGQPDQCNIRNPVTDIVAVTYPFHGILTLHFFSNSLCASAFVQLFSFYSFQINPADRFLN